MEREGKKEMTTSKDVLGELLESVMNIAGGDDGTEVTQVLSDLADVILKDKDVADVNRTAERRQQNSTSQHKIRLTEKAKRQAVDEFVTKMHDHQIRYAWVHHYMLGSVSGRNRAKIHSHAQHNTTAEASALQRSALEKSKKRKRSSGSSGSATLTKDPDLLPLLKIRYPELFDYDGNYVMLRQAWDVFVKCIDWRREELLRQLT
jgi:hypothetical protein